MQQNSKNNGGNLVQLDESAADKKIPNANSLRNIISSNMRCGDCSRLECERLTNNFCIEEGRLPTSKACGHFSPNFFPVAQDEQAMESLDQFAACIEGMGTKALRVVAGILLREPVTRKHGYRFLQKVFVRYQGSSSDNYLSNFCIAYVIDADKQRIRLVGASNRVVVTLYRPSTSIYTESQFAKMRKEMREAQRLVDPAIAKFARDFNLRRQMIGLDDLVETRVLDDALEVFSNGAPDKVKKRGRPSLDAFARTIDAGHMLPRRNSNVLETGDALIIDRSSN